MQFIMYGNLVLGITFIMSIIGIVSFGLFCVTCVQNMRTRSLLTAVFATTGTILPVTEASPLANEAIHQDMSYKGYILLSAFATYVTFKILKKLYNNFILYRFHIPVQGSPSIIHKTQIYVQMITASEQCMLHIAHIPTMVRNYKLELPENKAIQLDFCSYWLTSHIQINWEAIKLCVNDSQINLPVVACIPFHKTFKIRKMFKSKLQLRLIMFSDFYYNLCDPIECITKAKKDITTIEEQEFIN